MLILGSILRSAFWVFEFVCELLTITLIEKPLISAHRVRVRSVPSPGVDTSMAATSSAPNAKWVQKTITLLNTVAAISSPPRFPHQYAYAASFYGVVSLNCQWFYVEMMTLCLKLIMLIKKKTLFLPLFLFCNDGKQSEDVVDPENSKRDV